MGNGTLKDSYHRIETNDAEMARFRARLAQRFPVRKPIPLFVKALIPAAVVVSGVLISLHLGEGPGFPQRELAELEELARTASPAVLSKAEKLALKGDGPDRWNACVLLCLTEPMDQIADCVTEGLQEDPRPEVRAFYLEQLLERADEYQFNAEMIEELWDQEADEQCQRLYKDLFRIAA